MIPVYPGALSSLGSGFYSLMYGCCLLLAKSSSFQSTPTGGMLPNSNDIPLEYVVRLRRGIATSG